MYLFGLKSFPQKKSSKSSIPTTWPSFTHMNIYTQGHNHTDRLLPCAVYISRTEEGGSSDWCEEDKRKASLLFFFPLRILRWEDFIYKVECNEEQNANAAAFFSLHLRVYYTLLNSPLEQAAVIVPSHHNHPIPSIPDILLLPVNTDALQTLASHRQPIYKSKILRDKE